MAAPSWNRPTTSQNTEVTSSSSPSFCPSRNSIPNADLCWYRPTATEATAAPRLPPPGIILERRTQMIAKNTSTSRKRTRRILRTEGSPGWRGARAARIFPRSTPASKSIIDPQACIGASLRRTSTVEMAAPNATATHSPPQTMGCYRRLSCIPPRAVIVHIGTTVPDQTRRLHGIGLKTPGHHPDPKRIVEMDTEPPTP